MAMKIWPKSNETVITTIIVIRIFGKYSWFKRAMTHRLFLVESNNYKYCVQKQIKNQLTPLHFGDLSVLKGCGAGPWMPSETHSPVIPNVWSGASLWRSSSTGGLWNVSSIDKWDFRENTPRMHFRSSAVI